MSSISSALNSLQQGNWFKLICGASYQHLPSIRNLALVYSLAGADCIDMAADQAVIRSVMEGVKTARSYDSEAIDRGYKPQVDPLLKRNILQPLKQQQGEPQQRSWPPTATIPYY